MTPPDPVAALAEALHRVWSRSGSEGATIEDEAEYLHDRLHAAGWSLSHDSEREALVAVTDDLELMLRYRHDEAHNGDIVRFGPIETCGLCEPVWLHIVKARAAIEGRP